MASPGSAAAGLAAISLSDEPPQHPDAHAHAGSDGSEASPAASQPGSRRSLLCSGSAMPKKRLNTACHFCDHAAQRSGRRKVALQIACSSPFCRKVYCSRRACISKLSSIVTLKNINEFRAFKAKLESNESSFVCPHCSDESTCAGPQCHKRWSLKQSRAEVPDGPIRKSKRRKSSMFSSYSSSSSSFSKSESSFTSSMAAITLSQALQTSVTKPYTRVCIPSVVPPISATSMGPAALHYRHRRASLALSQPQSTDTTTAASSCFSFVVPKPYRIDASNARTHMHTLFQRSKP